MSNFICKFFSKSDIVFCPDICDEIPWLQKTSSSFSYATAGIMFCCSTESVEQLKNLDGFPINVLNSRALPKQENETMNDDIFDDSSTTTTEQIAISDIEMEANTINYSKFRYPGIPYNNDGNTNNVDDENIDEDENMDDDENTDDDE